MKKPVLNIYVSEAGEGFLKEVLAGVEEEGILCEIRKSEDAMAKELANRAAKESLVETGIGIDGKLVCVTISKLQDNEPLKIYNCSDKNSLRLAGCNAARIIKGIPLKY